MKYIEFGDGFGGFGWRDSEWEWMVGIKQKFMVFSFFIDGYEIFVEISILDQYNNNQ
jgi:hypothetical protein